MSIIPLTKGQVAIVDDDMYDYLSQWKWHVARTRHTTRRVEYYATRRKWIRDSEGRKKQLYIPMHKVVWEMKNGPVPVGMVVDHVHQSTLDNRMAELRILTQRESRANRRPWNCINLRGVYPHGNKFKARIRINKVYVYLGSFDTPEEASAVFEKKHRETYGF